MSKKLTPNVRFKGFSDDWEKRKLEQVVSNLRSYSLSRKVESSYPTHTKYIHYGDIHTRRAAKITSLSQLPDIIDGNYDYISYGDIAVADASEDYKDIAIPTILLSEDKNYSVVSGLHTIAFRPDKRMNPLFLYYLLFTQDFKHFVYREGQGLKVFGITKDNLFKYPISYPIKDEQNQVVQVFESLVSTIASNQKQLDQLKMLKKLFLQKIFDQEWRFKGFTDPWEQRKVSNLAEKTYGGGTPKTNKPEFWDGNIPWIQSSDLALGKVSTVNTRKYITNDAIEESAAKIIPANSIAIVTRVGVGKVAFISFPYATSQDFLSLSSLTEDPVFSTFLFSKLMEKESQSTQGTSIKGVTKKKVLAERVRIPTTMSEQFNIGILLKSLDSTIASNQKQLDQLKQLKKWFLQNLFV